MSVPGCVRANYPISRLTTVGTGGPARWFASPASGADLAESLAWARDERLSVAVVGLGSNLLVADSGWDGMVVKLRGELTAVSRDQERVVCGGGAPLAVVVKRCQGWGLAGMCHPRNRGRCGADERGRVRQRDA
jgi:UDP-N-acetylmuramate dehydrogenase